MTSHTDFHRSTSPNAAISLTDMFDWLARPDQLPPLKGGRPRELVQEKAAVAAELISRVAEAFDLDAASARDCAEQAVSLIQTRRHAPGASSGLAPWQAKRVAAFIEENLSRKVLIDDLARVARLSATHFARAFTKHFGKPPRTFLIARRVELAKQLMRSTQDALCQIALDCGFADQAHLSRAFRRLVGMSPHAWRSAQKRISAEALGHSSYISSPLE